MESLLATGDGQSFDPAKFKLLLQHRKVELQAGGGGGGGPPAAFPFLPGFNPAMFGLPPHTGTATHCPDKDQDPTTHWNYTDNLI